MNEETNEEIKYLDDPTARFLFASETISDKEAEKIFSEIPSTKVIILPGARYYSKKHKKIMHMNTQPVSNEFLTDHKITPANEMLEIEVLDGPGPGGANHHYGISYTTPEGEKKTMLDIHFQNGPLKKADLNGVTIEAFIAIAIHRLRKFQSGPFSCKENAWALTNLEAALYCLHSRTRNRQLRGVEGTMQK